MHAHILISVWARFDLDTANERNWSRPARFTSRDSECVSEGSRQWYDAFNAEGRRIYWRQIWDRLGTMAWTAGGLMHRARDRREMGRVSCVFHGRRPGAAVFMPSP